MLLVLISVISIVDRITASPLLLTTGNELLEAIYNDVQRVKNGSYVRNHQAGCSVCYDELGCFDRCNGVFNYIGDLPETPDKISTRFTLFSRRNRENGVSFDYRNVTPAAEFLDSPRTLIFIVHGFSSSASEPWVIDLKENILNYDDSLVVTVDWSRGCKLPFYGRAVVNTELVGREIALVLYKLIQISPEMLVPAMTHYIGHSLGAQMAMFFSEHFKTLSGGLQVGRISALDAAAPLLEAYDVCLNSSAANFIDGIHTSAGNNILEGKLGVTRQVGHLDLYVNGGSAQPGCKFFELTCAHQRAHDYYVEAVQRDAGSSCHFRSYACEGGIVEYNAGKCHKIPGVFNGISLDLTYSMPGRGVEFVDTRGSPPFCE